MSRYWKKKAGSAISKQMALGWRLQFGKKHTARALYLTLATINSEWTTQDIRGKKYRRIFHNFGIEKAFLNIT